MDEIEQRSAKVFGREAVGKYFRQCRSYSLCQSYSLCHCRMKSVINHSQGMSDCIPINIYSQNQAAGSHLSTLK